MPLKVHDYRVVEICRIAASARAAGLIGATDAGRVRNSQIHVSADGPGHSAPGVITVVRGDARDARIDGAVVCVSKINISRPNSSQSAVRGQVNLIE